MIFYEKVMASLAIGSLTGIPFLVLFSLHTWGNKTQECFLVLFGILIF